MALLVGLGLGLLLLEAGVRFRFPVPPPEAPVESNSTGFRDAEHIPAKPDGLMRIAFIGDSYTFGQGVRRDERFSERTAAALDETWPDVRVEMLNFGRPGANVADVLRIYEGGTAEFSPDIVVYSFVLNDFSTPAIDRRFRGERDRILEEHRARFPGLRWAADHLRTAAVLDRVLFDTTSGIEPAQLRFLEQLYQPGPDRDRMTAELTRLTRVLSREHLLSFVVFMPYFLPDEAALGFYSEARSIVAAAADRPRMEFVEVLPLLSERPFHEWWVSAADHHPNAAAHAVIAEALAAQILEITGNRWERFAQRRGVAAAVPDGEQGPPAAGIVRELHRPSKPFVADPE